MLQDSAPTSVADGSIHASLVGADTTRNKTILPMSSVHCIVCETRVHCRLNKALPRAVLEQLVTTRMTQHKSHCNLITG